MYLIKDLKLIRGDTWEIALKLQNSETKETIILGEGDRLYFTIKNSYVSDEFLIQKTLGNGITKKDDNKYHIIIEPEENSKLLYKDYVYDIEIKIGSEVIKTKTVKRGILTVDYEVTYLENEV